MSAAVQDNQLRVAIENADFGPLPMPSGLRESLTNTLNDRLLSLLAKLPAGVRLKNVAVAGGNLTLTAAVGK